MANREPIEGVGRKSQEDRIAGAGYNGSPSKQDITNSLQKCKDLADNSGVKAIKQITQTLGLMMDSIKKFPDGADLLGLQQTINELGRAISSKPADDVNKVMAKLTDMLNLSDATNLMSEARKVKASENKPKIDGQNHTIDTKL